MSALTDVEFVKSGPVARITIARPEKRNAISLRTAAEIQEAVSRAESDSDIRVIVLTGKGDRAFASGADLEELPGAMDTPEKAIDYDIRVGALYDALEKCALPVIARIHGAAIGGGCLLALACDFRVASEAATFALPLARIGLMLSVREHEMLLAHVTAARAKMLLFSGRRISAREALDWGLADAMMPAESLDSYLNELAHQIAACAPLTIMASKSMLRAIASDKAVDEISRACYERIYGSEDLQEGLAAIKERRKPVFRGR